MGARTYVLNEAGEAKLREFVERNGGYADVFRQQVEDYATKRRIAKGEPGFSLVLVPDQGILSLEFEDFDVVSISL